MDKNSVSQIRLSDLPISLKALFTVYLLTMAMGYFMAFLYLFLVNIQPHQEMGMDVLEGIVHKYQGTSQRTRLGSVLDGSMSEYISNPDKGTVFQWIQQGAPEENYSEVQPIFSANCLDCHNTGSGLVPLTTYEEIKSVAQMDLGESIKTLARVPTFTFSASVSSSSGRA